MKVVFFGLYTPLQGAPTIGAAIARVAADAVQWTMIGRGGCAIVTSDTPPQRQALGEAAVYVRPSDADDLARAITALAENRSELQRLRRAAHDIAVERFLPTTVTLGLSSTLLAAHPTCRVPSNVA